MKIRALVALALTAVVATGFSTFASAGAMSCSDSSVNGDTVRTWNFNSADACGSGEGNPNSSADIEALGGVFNLGTVDWAKQGGISANGDSSSWLNVSLVSGNWGDKVVTANWTLAENFWQIFGKAVFSVHVSNGSHEGLSDFGAFFITAGQYSGTWSFAQNPTERKAGGAGELSEARLWTAGSGIIIDNPQDPSTVPEPGVLLLLASGLLGLGLGKGRKAKA